MNWRNLALAMASLVLLHGSLLAVGAVAEPQQGSYWYAVDNITTSAEGARIVLWATLPADWQGQEVELGAIEPEPVAIITDERTGNRIVEWVVQPEPWQMGVAQTARHEFFHYEFELAESPVHIKVDPQQVGDFDRESEFHRTYTAPEIWIQTEGKILDQARAIVGDERNTWLQVRGLFDWIIHNLTFVPGGFGERDAISTLAGKQGDCGQYSLLLTAFCRSLGIPARTVTSNWVDGGRHIFAEVFLPGYDWVPVDPSLGQMLLPGGGGLSEAEVAKFMTERNVPLGDPFWFCGNLADNRLISTVGNNIAFASPTLGHRVSFRRSEPGGIDATPAAIQIEGLNRDVIHGGFYVFGNKVSDDEEAHSLVHQRLADSFFKVGLYDMVEDSCRRSLDDIADGIQAWINMGKVYMHKGEYYKAEAAFKRAMSGLATDQIEKLESLIWTHNYLGNCYDLLGHRDMALQEYEQVIENGNNYRGAVDYARKYVARAFLPDPIDGD